MLLTQVQIFAVLIGVCLKFCPVCFLVVPAWTLLYVCGLRVLFDVVTSSKLLFHIVSCDLGHSVCCNGKIWATCSPCSKVVRVWVIRMVYEHHLVCYDPVLHFYSLRIKIWIAPTGRVAVEVAHYHPSFSVKLNVMETWCLWWRRVQVVDQQRISFKQQFDSKDVCICILWSVEFHCWVIAFLTRMSSPPFGPLSLSLLNVSYPLIEKRWFELRWVSRMQHTSMFLDLK